MANEVNGQEANVGSAANPESEVLLDVKNLKTYFHLASGTARAVDGVSFTLSRGETLGVVGESGSGKSMMAKSLIRLFEANARIEEGSIEFEGRDVLSFGKKELRDYRGRDIGMIFQDPMTSLDPVFKVGQQMTENLRIHRNMSKAEAREVAIAALRSVNIPNPEARFNSYPFELSGGMCQRVIIAMALCCNAKVILADEPTTALDVTVQAQVLHLLKELQRTNNIGLMIITHNLGVVWDVCDRAMVMYAGKVVEAADVKSLYANPCTRIRGACSIPCPRFPPSAKPTFPRFPERRLICALRARRATSPTAAPMRRTSAARKFPSSSKSSRGTSSPAIGRRSMRISSA